MLIPVNILRIEFTYDYQTVNLIFRYAELLNNKKSMCKLSYYNNINYLKTCFTLILMCVNPC